MHYYDREVRADGWVLEFHREMYPDTDNPTGRVRILAYKENLVVNTDWRTEEEAKAYIEKEIKAVEDKPKLPCFKNSSRLEQSVQPTQKMIK